MLYLLFSLLSFIYAFLGLVATDSSSRFAAPESFSLSAKVMAGFVSPMQRFFGMSLQVVMYERLFSWPAIAAA